jgi:hypothetical protein
VVDAEGQAKVIEQDINERMARFAPSQAGPDVDPIAAEIAARASVPSAQPTMQEAPEVDPIAMQIATRQRESLNAAVLGARSVNPDEAARAEQLGQRIGIGPEIARADMARAEQQAYLMDLRAKDYSRTDPILANYLESRQFAETAHDDLGVLEMVKPLLLEAAMIQARGAPALFDAVSRGYQRGKKQVELGEMKAMGMVRYPTPKEREDIENLTKEIQSLGRGGVVGTGAEMIGQYAANLKEIGAFSAGGAAIGSVIPGVGTALGGGLGLAAGILKTTGTMMSGYLYATLKEDGVSDDVAIPAAIAGGFIGGLVEVVGGKIAAMPVQALAKRVMAETLSEALTRPTLQQAAKEFVKAYGLQVGGEAFEEGTQAISDMLAEEIALAASGIDSELTMREGFMRVIESTLYGAAGSAILGGVGPGANLLIDLRRASNTERQTKVFEDLAANRKESKYANRNPVGYERLLAAQAEEASKNGEDITTTYIRGDVATSILQQSGVPVNQLEDIVPNIRQQLAEIAEGKRSDLTLPTATFGAKLAGTKLGDAFLPHVRIIANGWSQAETAAWNQNKSEEIESARQILAQKQESDGAFVAEARNIYNDIRRQAMEAGQDSDTADVAASLYQAFVVTQAAGQNITPAQFQAQQGVRGIEKIIGEMAPMAAAPAVLRPPDYSTNAQLFGWNAQWGLASVAKKQGVNLANLTREEYVQFAIDNGFRINDDQLRMATTLRNATSMAEYQALRKSMRAAATPQQQQADAAFSSFAQQIKRDAASSKQIANGIRIRSGTANSDTWLYFKVNSGANITGNTYKAYAGFSNPYVTLTPDRVTQFMELLQSRGYNGDIKTIQDLDQGSSISDQIVMHGATEADARLAQQLSREFFGNELTFSEVGMDSATQSYSQILSEKIDSQIAANIANPAVSTNAAALEQAPVAPGFYSALEREVGAIDAKALTAAPGPRGGFDPSRLAILLNSSSDRTTLWHELVHFFLHMYTEAAVSGRASERQLNDLDLLLKWFKIEGNTPAERLANWNAMTLDQKRKHHEALTYNAEIYAFEGKAPSAELVPVFERLRAFMLRVYKSIRDDLNAIYRREFGEDLPILTGEVRQVMDRMLATDEQIKRQAAINEMKPQFQTQEQSGMDDAEWAAYQAMQQEAIEASITDMNKASMRQLQWLGNARSRILRDMQKKHDAKRKEVAAEVAAAVRVEPVYRAMTYLRTGKFIDADGAEVEMEGPHRLDIKQVKAIYAGMPSEEAVGPIRATGMAVPVTRPQFERLGYGKYGMLAEDGVAPDLVAETFGFGSGDQMIRALLKAKPMKEAVAERTDAEMLRRYGDMNTPEAQEAEVQKALHNEARARFVAVELRHIARATEPVRVMLEAAKQVARELIAGMTLRDVRPGDFVAAEARAARDASRVGATIDPEAIGRAAETRALNEALEAGTDPAEAMAAAMEKGAEAARKAQERSDALKAQYGADPQQALIRAKRAQLYQNQLAAEALRVREEVAKQVKYLRRILRDTNVKAMGAQAADQIAALLERFEVAPVSLKRLDERKALAAWLAEQEAAGLVPDIAPEVADEARRVNYQQLTVAEFRDLVDAIRQIEFIGKNERKVQLAAERAAYKEKRDEIVTRIRAVGRLRGVKFDPRSPLTNIGRSAAALRGFAAQHLKAASVARILDGGEDDGPLWTFAIRSANAAVDMETRMRAEASAKLAEILAPVFKLGNMGGKGVFFPTINRSLNREARIAIAMNVGNDGNRQRLLDGEGWTMEQIQPILESLTEAEWKAVQQVWDYIDTYRPLIAEKERRLYGKEPEWVKATPFTTRTADGREVRLEGGYYPIKYDPIASDRVATVDEAAEAKRALDGAYTAATTRRSFVKSRVREVVGRPLLYTLDAAFGGVNDVIHDLAWHEWLIQTQRLLRDPEFANAVRETRGPEYLKQLRDWAKDNAAGERKVGVAGEAALSWLRQGISASGLGFNVVSAAMQVTGFNQSIVRLGAKYVGRGVAQFAASPIDTARMVADKSSFMAERGRTQFREINEIRNRVRGQTEVARRVTSGTYFLMMNMQRTVDIPTWLAGYQKALDAGKDDATAVALADQAVRDTQGSGLISDLSAIERGGPMMKLFTVFYSYMNTVYNMTAVQTMTARSKGKLAADYAMLLVVPVVLGQAIKNAIQPDAGDDELDPEALARKLAAEELSFLMGTMVIVREFGGAAQLLTGAEGVRMGYGGPAGLRAVGEVYGLATQAGQLEFDRAFRRSAINTLGAFTGLPSAQINRTIDGIEAIMEGEVEGVGAVVAPLTGVRR